jgi:MinD-like ATPase involved in chromosome partitioning or flagellar assembly
MTNTPLATRAMKTIALTSGKGGVGKSNIAVNLAITLAKRGAKVCILDADTGLANINILLGATPQYTLEHLLNGEKTLTEILFKGPGGIHIIPGASGVAGCVELAPEQQALLISALDALEPHYDYLIIDTGAGISPTVLHFVAAAQMPVVILTPEPTSLTDAFSLLKVLRRSNFKRPIYVLVNMASSANKACDIFNRFQAAVDKYTGLRVRFLGTIWRDQAIATSVVRQYPVALGSPNTPACQNFNLIADNIDKTYKTGLIKLLRFRCYWQQRMAKAAEEKAAQISSTETLEPIKVSAPTLQACTESDWQCASMQLKQLIEHGSIRQEQIGKLISELTTLTNSQNEKTKLTSDLKNPHTIQPTNLNTEFPSESSLTGPHPKAPIDNAQSPRAITLKHQYDESTFGSQALLLKNLRADPSRGGTPLLALLENVRSHKTPE